jgi:hypothetical protein
MGVNSRASPVLGTASFALPGDKVDKIFRPGRISDVCLSGRLAQHKKIYLFLDYDLNNASG